MWGDLLGAGFGAAVRACGCGFARSVRSHALIACCCLFITIKLCKSVVRRQKFIVHAMHNPHNHTVAQHFVSSFWLFWFEPPIFQNRIFLLDDFRECANGFIRVATLFVNVAADHGDSDGLMLQIVPS